MNPSYTNPVDGTNAGGTKPQVSGGSVPVQPTAPVGANPMPTPSFSQNMPLSSGTGDIVLGGNAPEKKSRKGLIVLIVALVLLVLVGGGLLLWQSGVLGGGEQSQDQNAFELKENYNKFVNYVLYGEEDASDIDYIKIIEAKPYFEQLTKNEMSAYLENVNTKYNLLKNAYEKHEGEEEINISALKVFFEDYPKIMPLTREEFLRLYSEKGEKAVINEINNRYGSIDGASEETNDYLLALREDGEFALRLLNSAKAAGCLRDEEIIDKCYNMTEADLNQSEEISRKVYDAGQKIGYEASETLEKMYDLIYGGGNNND